MPANQQEPTTGQVRPETLRDSLQMARIGNRAVRRAQEQNRALGVPNAYHVNGQLVYELPDGTIATEDPWHGQKTPPDDWPWRDRWEKNVAQKLAERRKQAAGLVSDK